jgi:hypothetical protein
MHKDSPAVSHDELDLDALASACMEAVPEVGNASLLQALQECLPDLTFKQVLTRSGWYRIGGIVDANGRNITDNLADWAEQESAGDAIGLYNKYVDESLIATRLSGMTHYLVAQVGTRPQDFIQLEVEEVQEVMHRPLFETDVLPELIEEIIDPLEYTQLEPEPISPPRYMFRRVIPVAAYLDDLIKLKVSLPVVRFMADWERSSAGESAVFSEHWVLGLREFTDGYGEKQFRAKPITTYSGDVLDIGGSNPPRGAELATLIHEFDRRVGYPMAWYFFMLSHKQVSHQIAESIHDDLMGAYAYLPPRDIRVLQDWYDHGYGV